MLVNLNIIISIDVPMNQVHLYRDATRFYNYGGYYYDYNPFGIGCNMYSGRYMDNYGSYHNINYGILSF
jgi:hypothetical protein